MAVVKRDEANEQEWAAALEQVEPGVWRLVAAMMPCGRDPRFPGWVAALACCGLVAMGVVHLAVQLGEIEACEPMGRTDLLFALAAVALGLVGVWDLSRVLRRG